MRTINIKEIKTDVEDCQESLMQRSDVYKSERVIIRPEKYRDALIVIINGLPAKDFKLNQDSTEVAIYIWESINRKK